MVAARPVAEKSVAGPPVSDRTCTSGRFSSRVEEITFGRARSRTRTRVQTTDAHGVANALVEHTNSTATRISVARRLASQSTANNTPAEHRRCGIRAKFLTTCVDSYAFAHDAHDSLHT